MGNQNLFLYFSWTRLLKIFLKNSSLVFIYRITTALKTFSWMLAYPCFRVINPFELSRSRRERHLQVSRSNFNGGILWTVHHREKTIPAFHWNSLEQISKSLQCCIKNNSCYSILTTGLHGNKIVVCTRPLKGLN